MGSVSRMRRVREVLVSTSCGGTSLRPGTSRTSSKVRASPANLTRGRRRSTSATVSAGAATVTGAGASPVRCGAFPCARFPFVLCLHLCRLRLHDRSRAFPGLPRLRPGSPPAPLGETFSRL